MHGAQYGDDRAAPGVPEQAAVGQELAQFAVVADADEDRVALARERREIASQRRRVPRLRFSFRGYVETCTVNP